MTQYIFLVSLVSSLFLSCCLYATAGNDGRAGISNPSNGLRIGYVGVMLDGNEVLGVVAGSPAAKAHLMKGDLIVSVNNYETKASKGNEVGKSLRGVVGTSVALVVQRGGKNYSCTLVRSEALVQPGITPRFEVAAAVPKSSPAPAPSADPSLNSLIKPDKTDLEMISIFRNSADSAPAYNRVIEALHHIPISRRDELSKWGLKIVIAPTIVDAHPQFATEKPRGYLHGGTYQNCPGLFMPTTKTIYVAEKASMGNNPFQQNVWILSTMLHEFGHALDAYEYRSKSPEFTKVYTEDSQRLTNELRNTYYYYTQSDEAGPSELFAELFSIASGGGEYSLGLDRAFPKCFKYVKQIESQ